jgi:hypothetical protein
MTSNEYLHSQRQSCSYDPRIEEDAFRLLREAAEVLDHISENHNLQHLDIKPSNLLVQAGHCKVADFGTVASLESTVPVDGPVILVVRSDSDPDVIETLNLRSQKDVPWVGAMRPNATLFTGLGAFTPYYAPPEAFKGQFSRSFDQYSLALTFCEWLGGRLPFSGSVEQQLDQRQRGEVELAFLPSRLHAPLREALSPDPGARYYSCVDFAQALHRAAGQPFPPISRAAHSARGYANNAHRAASHAEKAKAVACLDFEALVGACNWQNGPDRALLAAAYQAAGHAAKAKAVRSHDLVALTWACDLGSEQDRELLANAVAAEGNRVKADAIRSLDLLTLARLCDLTSTLDTAFLADAFAAQGYVAKAKAIRAVDLERLAQACDPTKAQDRALLANAYKTASHSEKVKVVRSLGLDILAGACDWASMQVRALLAAAYETAGDADRAEAIRSLDLETLARACDLSNAQDRARLANAYDASGREIEADAIRSPWPILIVKRKVWAIGANPLNPTLPSVSLEFPIDDEEVPNGLCVKDGRRGGFLVRSEREGLFHEFLLRLGKVALVRKRALERPKGGLAPDEGTPPVEQPIGGMVLSREEVDVFLDRIESGLAGARIRRPGIC